MFGDDMNYRSGDHRRQLFPKITNSHGVEATFQIVNTVNNGSSFDLKPGMRSTFTSQLAALKLGPHSVIEENRVTQVLQLFATT